MMEIEKNIAVVRDKIAQAAQRCGRDPKEITLIGVSKTIDMERMKQAEQGGITHFGENKPQELRDKFPHFPNATWHMIGTLQTNKVKYVVGKAALIHSVDSIHVLEAIDTRAKQLGCIQQVLLQVKLTDEESKSGFTPPQLYDALEQTGNYPNITVCGLMTIGNPQDSMEQTRKLFENCNNLFIDIQGKTYHNICMKHLSMGMSGDFEAAIEMGATMIRVGTGIFGARHYQIEGGRMNESFIQEGNGFYGLGGGSRG